MPVNSLGRDVEIKWTWKGAAVALFFFIWAFGIMFLGTWSYSPNRPDDSTQNLISVVWIFGLPLLALCFCWIADAFDKIR